MIELAHRVLTKHRDFSDEELDCIINYDIKYRMGDAFNEPGSPHNLSQPTQFTKPFPRIGMNQEPHFPKDFRILAIVNDKRQLTRQDTNEVIQFRPGSLIEIVFSEGTLEEGTQDPKLGKWKLVEFLPSGTEIYIDVNRSRQKWEGEGILTNNPLSPADYYLGSQSGALVRLDEDLKLEYAKGKQSKLHRCECTIVTSGQKARSLNHAYTLASRMFEKDRISNTGNVFQKCYYTRPGDSQRVRLSERRREVEAKAAGDSE